VSRLLAAEHRGWSMDLALDETEILPRAKLIFDKLCWNRSRFRIIVRRSSIREEGAQRFVNLLTLVVLHGSS
jgi:hypothetical protein